MKFHEMAPIFSERRFNADALSFRPQRKYAFLELKNVKLIGGFAILSEPGDIYHNVKFFR